MSISHSKLEEVAYELNRRAAIAVSTGAVASADFSQKWNISSAMNLLGLTHTIPY